MKHPGDEPRLLSRSGTPPYTHVAMLALREEPEAISADEQWLMSEQARRTHAAELAGEWRKASSRIKDAVSHFETVGRPPQDLAHQLRAIERTTSAVDRRFSA